MSTPIRVLIADDHEVVLIGLRMLLEREGLRVVGVARTGSQVVELVRKTKPDVVLLDILMPEMGGLEALEGIQSLKRPPRIIISTAHPKSEYLVQAIRSGAAGFVTKDESPASIVAAVRSVAAGSTAVSRKALLRAFKDARPEDLGDLAVREGLGADLTRRELEVAALIGRGLDNAEIAQELSISLNTVRSHLRKIYFKLDASDRTKVALWAIDRGLTD